MIKDSFGTASNKLLSGVGEALLVTCFRRTQPSPTVLLLVINFKLFGPREYISTHQCITKENIYIKTQH